MGKHLFRTKDQYREILLVYEECGGVNETARQTGIPHTTVHRFINRYQTLERFEAEYNPEPKISTLEDLKKPFLTAKELHYHYAYMLGIYLGDGHISKVTKHRAHRIMIFLDMKYPLIIDRCKESMQAVFPSNSIGIVNKTGCVSVNCYSQELPEIFPQHGADKKHNRPIILENWQQKIVDLFPLEFFRGLYHSDGSRSRNVVKGKNYERYFFTNESDDIRKLYSDTVEKLGLAWTQTNRISIAISRREDVAWLDEHVGAKA
jgi:hypothetical protein